MIPRFFGQIFLILLMATVGAVATRLITGPPVDPTVCSAELLKDGEVCLDTILTDWSEETVVWVDARARKEWDSGKVEGAFLINIDPAEDYDAMLAEAVEGLALADRVVVYCGKSGCQASKEIAKRLDETGLVRSVHTLFGGVKALKAGGLLK